MPTPARDDDDAHPADPERRRRPVAARRARPARRRRDRGRRPVGPHARPRRRLPRPDRRHRTKEAAPMSTLSYAVSRLGDDAAPPASGTSRRYPSMTVMLDRHADRLPAAVRLRVRRHPRRRPRRVRRPLRRTGGYVDYVTPAHPAVDGRRRRPGHRDLGRHGHDRGHHRPLPHHGHRPRLGAHRTRARQPDPDDARPRARASASRC